METATRTRPLTDDPFLLGEGPVECSSSTALSLHPEFIFDVNNYYRELRVDPRATRAQLRVAYTDLDGQSSPRLTYVFRQLLNPATRYEYDRMPFGSEYLDDYVMDRIHRALKSQVDQRRAEMVAEGTTVDVDDDSILRDLYAERGLLDEDEDEEVLDQPLSGEHDSDQPAEVFPYAYYMWRTRGSGVQTQHVLQEWQSLLISALSKEGVTTRFAVGLHGGMEHPFVLGAVGYRTVVFLNHRLSPTADLARDAAVRVKQHLPHDPTT